MDLVQWLRDQFDIDAARATAAAEEDGPDWRYDGHAVITRREGDLVAVGSQDFMESGRGEFIAAHDPAGVLREIDTARELLSRYEAMAADVLVMTGVESILAEYRRVILPNLAQRYADRPGYAEALAAAE